MNQWIIQRLGVTQEKYTANRFAMLTIGILFWISMTAQSVLNEHPSSSNPALSMSVTSIQDTVIQVQKNVDDLTAQSNRYKHEIGLIQGKIDGNNREIVSKNQTIAQNDQRLLGLAKMCLIEPYDKNMIDGIGTTAFNAIQDASLKKTHEVLPIIMANQPTYVSQLHAFFREYRDKIELLAPKKEVTHPEKSPMQKVISDVMNKYPTTQGVAGNAVQEKPTNVICRAFENLPVYQDYMKFGDGWENTYLGKFLFEAHQKLKTLTPETSKSVFSELTAKLDALHIK